MRGARLLLGSVAANVVAVLLVLLVWFGLNSAPNAQRFAVLPSLILIPFCGGLVAACVWRSLNPGIGACLLHSVVCLGLTLIIGTCVFKEGVVCLIIVSPVLYAGIAAGALAGRIWFRKRRDRVNLCLAPLLALVAVTEPSFRSHHSGVVTDEIRIAARPAKIWPHLLAFKPIPERPRYWLFRLGLPYPTETTHGGNCVGADRACRFSGNAVFKETVAEFVPEKLLTFDIIEMPRDPELIGHLDAHRGQFEIVDNGDGSSTLIGRTWYSLHVRPAFYFDWWTHDIFSAVHLRVMRNVKRLAETSK